MQTYLGIAGQLTKPVKKNGVSRHEMPSSFSRGTPTRDRHNIARHGYWRLERAPW